jgi:hypothetical protein
MDEGSMTSEHTAHGLDGRLVEPDWSPLTFAEVCALLARFPSAGEPVEILTVSPRPFSAASVVATTKGRVFVKRHPRAVRDRDGLLEEHRFMAHLHAQGAPVPRVLETADGETAIESATATYEVHETPPSLDIYQDAASWTPFLSANHARAAGVAMARLHHSATRGQLQHLRSAGRRSRNEALPGRAPRAGRRHRGPRSVR